MINSLLNSSDELGVVVCLNGVCIIRSVQDFMTDARRKTRQHTPLLPGLSHDPPVPHTFPELDFVQ